MKYEFEVTVTNNNEIMLSEAFLKTMNLKKGDKLTVLGDIENGIALKKYDKSLIKAMNIMAAMGLIEKGKNYD